MRLLEETWGLDLFDRSSRTPRLTQTGLALVGEAQSVLSAYDSLPDKVGAKLQLSGELILGAVPTTLTGLVPLALSELKIRQPDIKVRVVPGLTNRLLLQLDRDQIHAAIISRPEIIPPTLQFAKVASETLVLIASEKAPNENPTVLLRTQPFIRFNRDAVVGRQVEAWLQREDIAVNDVMELEGLEAISSMVAAGLGISIVPQRCIREASLHRLKTIPLGQTSPVRHLGLASRKDTPKGKMITAAEQSFHEAVLIGEFKTARD
ncbi:HTH-type transcriptional regulator GltR [Pontivivens insulae]|uniref:HTH-type transcriptional regulator GltR n=2 Tax=Pontivivens insulae TaxID=1639689 RepID=A0A2R8A8Y8_9RHOB|nr:HTH-type transcriptional regulator GltR [Pontivivens insulae]